MDKALLAALNDADRLLVAETEPAALALLDEDAAVELHARVRRARAKYVGQYRRGASARVATAGGRGKARPQNTLARTRAEAFEVALSRVSRRLSVLAKESAAALKAERLAAARGEKAAPAASGTKAARKAPATSSAPKPRTARSGDRSLRGPATEKRRAGTRATGDRRQAERDSR